MCVCVCIDRKTNLPANAREKMVEESTSAASRGSKRIEGFVLFFFKRKEEEEEEEEEGALERVERACSCRAKAVVAIAKNLGFASLPNPSL